ncbi:MAG: hypothetical protein QGG89_11305, partial [Vicinamibacterales bacterium]|nr:hypothetical protein [Vicinamibacterales bacterium]
AGVELGEVTPGTPVVRHGLADQPPAAEALQIGAGNGIGIEPGQDAAAAALAREMVALVNERYPGAEMTARTGRWMTGFQSLAAPVNQIRFTEQHPDLETRDIFTAILLGDDDFETLQRKVAEVIDFGSCADTQFRARP